jgi:integrase
VFCTTKGTLINPTNLRKRSFAPLLDKAGLPHMTFHQLRHTAATILLLKNVNPKIVSEMLGHASIAITLDTYSHVLPNMQDSAIAAMEEAFSSWFGPRWCRNWRSKGLAGRQTLFLFGVFPIGKPL